MIRQLSLFLIILCFFINSSLFASNEPDKMTLTGDNIEYDGKGGYLAEGNVVAKKIISGSIFKADKAKFQRNAKTKKIITASAEGNVLIIDQGKKVTCGSAFYDKNKGYIRLRNDIKLTSLEYNLLADYLEFNEKTGEGKITSKTKKLVQFTFLQRSKKNPLDSRLVTGHANKILIKKRAGKLIMQKKAFFEDPLDKTRFNARRIVVFFNKSNEVEEIIADGKFRMQQKGRISSANQASFNYKTQVVTLIGNVSVKETGKDKNNSELKGELVKMYMEVDKGIIKGGEGKPVQIEFEIN